MQLSQEEDLKKEAVSPPLLTQKEQLGISLLNETLLEQIRVKQMQPGRIDLVWKFF